MDKHRGTGAEKDMQWQRRWILQKLQERGCRVTKQRQILLDIILEGNCTSCKEIYYRATKKDEKIGSATVYRMVNALEEIGAINRKNMYKIEQDDNKSCDTLCLIEFDDNSTCQLTKKNWYLVMQAGLLAYGYMKEKNIQNVVVKPCEGNKCSRA